MTRWKYFLKIIYRVSVFLLFFIPCVWILWRYIPLEFASDSIGADFFITFGFLFLAAILGTMAGTLKRTDHPGIIIGKILLTLFGVFCSFMLLVSISFSMCAWSEDKTLFINKRNNNITIVAREYGCGATDGGPPVIKIARKRKITSLFVHIRAIDTITIDKEKWIRVVANE